MSEELDNVDNEIQEYLEMFKDCDLPNPEQEPNRFAWYVKMFRYYKSK